MLIFRLPFQQQVYTTDDETDESFVSFFSFNQQKSISFPGKIIPLKNPDLVNQSFPLTLLKENAAFETREDYLIKITKTIAFIKENQLQKLVIAKKKYAEISEPDLWGTFGNLCEKYPSAFVYAFMDAGECWIGAFSELLGNYHKKSGKFTTMSLAGTLPVEEKWTQKEIREQQPVTEYIRNILQKYDSHVDISPTYDHVSGNIKHLRNDFSIRLDRNRLDELIGELHPTPAVCGIPKGFCKKAIFSFEGFDREYYAGYSKIETDEDLYYFVNLRCGKLYKNAAVLFAGGGITAMSDPQNEWRETELKADALLRNIMPQ